MAQITREQRKNGKVSIRVRAQLSNKMKGRGISQVGLTRYTYDESKIPELIEAVERRRKEVQAIYEESPNMTDHEQEQAELNRFAYRHRWGVAKPDKHNFAFRWMR